MNTMSFGFLESQKQVLIAVVFGSSVILGCSPTVGTCPEWICGDPDGDGFSAQDGDCDPYDSSIYPGSFNNDCGGSSLNTSLDTVVGSCSYQGGWPCNLQKEEGPGPDAPFAVGEQFQRFQLKDQFGDEVDLYDFSGHGKQVLVDISAQWCPPCNGLAAWLDGQPDDYGFEGAYPGVVEAVENGDVFWITVLTQQNDSSEATEKTCTEWYDMYPHPRIPVLAGGVAEEEAVNLVFLPSIILLDENMRILATQDDDFMSKIDF